MKTPWKIWWRLLWCHFRDIRSHPRTTRYKTKKKGHTFLNKILVCHVPSFSIQVGRVILLIAVRNGRFGGGWLSTPSSTFATGTSLVWLSCIVPQCTVLHTGVHHYSPLSMYCTALHTITLPSRCTALHSRQQWCQAEHSTATVHPVLRMDCCQANI